MSDPRMRLVLPDASQDFFRPKSKRQLGRLLVSRGAISTSDLLTVLGEQRLADAQLGHLLLANGMVSETELYQALAIQHQAQFVSQRDVAPDLSLQAHISPDQALRASAVPWKTLANATLVATSQPDEFDSFAAQLPAHLHPLIMAIAPKSDIETAIQMGNATALAERAEFLIPHDLSCRDTPKKLIPWLGLLAMLLILALALRWITLSQIYAAVFLFALSMVCVGMVLKSVGACLHLLAKVPIWTAPRLRPDKNPKVSLLVPLHDESDILSALLGRLSLIAYPKTLLDVILVIEASDTRTRAHLEQSQLPAWMRVLIVPKGNITTKPRAMNYALPFCKGEIIGIYDAEDAPHPEQLNDVVATFMAEPQTTACIQAVLDFYNARSNALARFFAIEYATWFRLVLPGVARMGFAIPLGGTSVFFRRDALEKLHGWDAHNVTEDADLGIRLARAGYRTKLIQSVTLEEANNSTWPWIKQRSRWLKGYLITYFTHMRSPLRLLYELGLWKFIGFQAFFLSSISQYMLAPLIWSCILLQFGAPNWMQSALPDPLLNVMILSFIAMWCASTAIYVTAVSGRHHRHLIPWCLGMTFYMALGTLAIYKGAWELVTRPFYWDKTAHGHSPQPQPSPKPSQAAVQTVEPPGEPESSLSRVTKATEI